MSDVRIEKDFLGEKEIPADRYYGIQTQRSLDFFHASGTRCDSSLIRAYIQIKRSAAVVHQTLGVLDATRTSAMITACDEMLAGQFLDHIVVDAFQAGGGTSLNMNVNEVIANRALTILGKSCGEYGFLSPNDHVNYGQSTNDTFPTALHLAALDRWSVLSPILLHLAETFEEKGRAFHHILKGGRTHLQDAVPIRLGQEFRAYAHSIRRSHRMMKAATQELFELAISGTAVGTGLNAASGFGAGMIDELRKRTGLSELRLNPNLHEAIQSLQSVAFVSSALRTFALECIRISENIRLLASGPAIGFAEIKLPAVQPGSSIMPAKENPSLPEGLSMIAFQVVGNDLALSLAVQAGQLELNVMTPVIASNLFSGFQLLINFLPVFTRACIAGIEANEEQCREYALRTTALGTVLNPVIGYVQAAEVIKEVIQTKQSLREVVIKKKILTEQEIDRLLDPERLTGESDHLTA